MEVIKQGVGILRRAENALRALVAQAASQGDYESASLFVSWAQTLAALAVTKPGKFQRLRDSGADGRTGKPQRVGRRSHQWAGSTDSHRSYPRFYRSRKQIVKVGWSKRLKREYRHRAPVSVLTVLSATLAEVGTDGRVFSTDEFMPLREGSGDADWPTYQVYVCLALLKNFGLVEQHGRQGYSIPDVAGLSDAVKTALDQLPEQ